MARPRKAVSDREFLRLYSSGYNDCHLAEKLGISRMTVARKRSELGLKANSCRGWRGLSMHGDELYWSWVEKALNRYPDLARIMRITAAELLKNGTIDYATYYLCLGSGPLQSGHSAKTIHGQSPCLRIPDMMEIDSIIRQEKRLDMSSLAAVPGPDFINLARVFKTAGDETIRSLAESAIIHSGLVNIHTRMEQICSCTPLSMYEAFWEELREDACGWLNSVNGTVCSMDWREAVQGAHDETSILHRYEFTAAAQAEHSGNLPCS